MSLYPTKAYPIAKGLSEFDILKASHKFLRDDEANDNNDNANTTTKDASWEDLLAEKYYSNLYREFALCDLKHYKSGNFALRWRTESEVLSGAGETTCGNTRCKHHHHQQQHPQEPQNTRKEKPRLTTLELPFAYMEHGESKHALVKVVLCPKCVKKLMWKRRKEKEKEEVAEGGGGKGEGSALIVQPMQNGEKDAIHSGEPDGVDSDNDDGASEELEDVFEKKVERKGKGKAKEEEEMEKVEEARGGNGGKGARDFHSRLDLDERGRKKRHRREYDGSEEPHSRRRSSRSRSPRRAHASSSSHSHPRKRGRERNDSD